MRKSLETLRQEVFAAKMALTLALAEDVRVGNEYTLTVTVVDVDTEIGRARVATENETLMWVDCAVLHAPVDTRPVGESRLRVGQLAQVTQYGTIRAVDTNDNSAEVSFTRDDDPGGRVIVLGLDETVWFDMGLVEAVGV